ncbi:MAG: D-aminoacyl-tRNA deacylase, partial [Bacteroidota bacterium]|nr:D-aminoacyl-tRNA deacylase [Bacteroidota bacterium]
TLGLRIFTDINDVMNFSVQDVDGDVLIVSQFTLHALTKKGNRPSYIKAAKAETALPLYRSFVEQCDNALGRPVATGVFGAMMDVELHNDGPVTILMDSKNKG